MVIVKEGEIIKSKKIRKGVSAKGEYFLIEKKAEKGYDKINVWASNPGDVQNASAVKVVKVEQVRFAHKQNPNSGQWTPEVSVTAQLTAVEVEETDNKDAVNDYWMKAPDDAKDIFNMDF